MGDSACVMNPFSSSTISNEAQQDLNLFSCTISNESRQDSFSSTLSNEARQNLNRIHDLGESVSFGRFTNESLSWEKWSTFTHKRYVEEAKSYAQPGSVAEKKAFFEAHYKKIAAKKAEALALLEQQRKSELDNVVENGPIETPRRRGVWAHLRKGYEEDKGGAESEVSGTSQSDKPLLKKNRSSNEEASSATSKKRTPFSPVNSSAHQHRAPPPKVPALPARPKTPAYLKKVKNVTPIPKTSEKTSLPSLITPAPKKPISVPTNQKTIVPLLNTPITTEKTILPSITKKLISGPTNEKTILPSLNIPITTEKTIIPSLITPITKKPISSPTNEKGSSLASIINFPFTEESDKSDKATQKVESCRDAQTLQTPRQATPKGFSKLPSGAFSSDKRRTKRPVDPSLPGSKTAGPKWHILSAVSKSFTACRNKLRSPSPSTPFRLRTEERATQRKQKLEDKFNANQSHQTEKVQHQRKFKEKAETELRKLRQSFCFKARPLPDFYKQKETSKSQILGQPPELGRKASSGKLKEGGISSLPPLTTRRKKGSFENVSKSSIKFHGSKLDITTREK